MYRYQTTAHRHQPTLAAPGFRTTTEKAPAPRSPQLLTRAQWREMALEVVG